ncbi:MAG: hypothetical protein U1E52_05025 [Geminicoccaceae bacterium]
MKPLSAAIIAALALAGCTEIVREPAPRSAVMIDEPGGFVVQERPPVMREEIVPLAPGPGYAWHPGHWRWENGWAWAPGRYIARPHPEAVWVPGHWAARRYGWSWIPGHWD